MMTTGATSSARDIAMRSPFTSSQWQELEHQALIFKYMVSGVAIPPELIYSVKRSLDSSMNTRPTPHQPIGWGCFQVGFGRKADPEPGRCRRTDGKKWRCSKEAYPDSKYCERHMHRGRNRSRKPVEIISSSSSSSSSNCSSSSSSSSASTTATLVSSSTLLNRNLSMINSTNTSTTAAPLMSSEIYQDPLTHHQKSTYLNNPYLYPHQQNKSTYNMISSSGFSSPHDHNNTTTNTPHHMFLDSGSYSDKDYSRYFHGIKDHQGVVDERDFFPEASGSVRGGINIHHHHQDSICQPLMTTNSFRGYSHDHHHQSHQFHQSFSHHNSKPQHCFVLGTDFKSSTSSASRAPLKIDKEDHDHHDDETQKPLHHFFGEWPPKNTDSAWLDLASNSRVHNWIKPFDCSSKTQVDLSGTTTLQSWTIGHYHHQNTVQKSTCLLR
ncbi:hypothetical protein Dsin_014312 [Dipteronia sinensis]|uniref:Growth-regulating factor n=1 Tax=Dipteronia sinensis TaxID=43782 RepID=A0AAE0EA73_9ROSI|nr:hypothetical protein Dsin_014312 [Dipteronia sinensis]